MKKSIKKIVKTDFTKLALMAIASGVMLSSPLSGNDDYRSSARNRRIADNGNQNQTNPYQNQTPNNPYMDQNSSNPYQDPNQTQRQTPGNLNQTSGRVASGGGCKGNGKCRGTSYNYDNQDSNNPAGRYVAENDNMDTLNNNNRKNKELLDENSKKDTINNYNDTDRNNEYMNDDYDRKPGDNSYYNTRTPNGNYNSSSSANCKASSGCEGKSRNEQGYQQDYNNNLRQNRLSI